MNEHKFLEIDRHLMSDEKPSSYLVRIENEVWFRAPPFRMLSTLKGIEQSKQHHPEGDVWKHTVMVVDEAAKRKIKSENQRVFMWAALLHDVGKAETTRVRKGKITSYDHDVAGATLAMNFLREFCTDDAFVVGVSRLVRWHMQLLHVIKENPFAQIDDMKREISIGEVALLGLCDRLGRGGAVDVQKEEKNAARFIVKCDKIKQL